jgi:uncharacterized protein (DUF58 family)
MESLDRRNVRRILREFLVTTFLLGSALGLAILSTIFVQADDFRLTVISAVLALILASAGGIYIVPKLSKRINLRLFSWKFSYSATAETAFFLVLTIIVGFSAINTGNNLLYLVFSVLVAVLIASALITEGTLRDIDVSLRFPENIFATQETTLELSLINRKRFWPSYSLTVGVMTDVEVDDKKLTERVRQLLLGPQLEKGLGKLAHYSILPGGTKLSQRISYTFPRRGSYHINGFLVSTKFPFGFLRKTHEKEASGEVIVYPQPQPIGNFSTVIAALTGWLESITRGNSSDLYMLRQYVPNDNMRHIDWKATAKSRQLMVREYTSEDERRFTIVMDDFYDSTLPNFDQKFERAVTLAASLAEYFTKQGCEMRLLTPEHQTEFETGHEHFYKVLRLLALIQPHRCNEEHEIANGFKSINELVSMDERDFKILITAAPQRVSIQHADLRVVSLSKL